MTTGKIKFVEDDGGVEEMEELESDEEQTPEETGGKPSGGEPPLKKLKKDLTKDAEEKLQLHTDTAEDKSLSSSEKFAKISEFLEYLYENNVNTLEFQSDFSEWAKTTLTGLFGDVEVTSVECYHFLCNILKLAPTVVEPVCEKVLEVIYVKHGHGLDCDQALEAFMEKLSYTFEKLRRFPKLIAKLLRCVRDNVGQLGSRTEAKQVRGKKRKSTGGLGVKVERSAGFIFSKRFMESYSAILSMLPPGQMIDLWKTLQHNLEEEGVKKLKTDEDNPTLISFLAVVVDLTAAFLYSIKVADYSVPLSTVERINEVMGRLKDHALVDLGEMITSNNESPLLQPFLKLSMAWGHLNQFMIVYNASYGGKLPTEMTEESSDAEDLSVLLPYLTGGKWKTLWKSVAKKEDSAGLRLMVCLVALKLKCLAVVDQHRKGVREEELLKSKIGKEKDEAMSEEGDDDDVGLRRCLEEAAYFIWTHQQMLTGGEEEELIGSREVLDIASAYMDNEKVVDYARGYLEGVLHGNMGKAGEQMENVIFHVALVLEALQEGLRRLTKMGLMKNAVKKFLGEGLSQECKLKVLEGLGWRQRQDSEELKPFVLKGVEVVNKAILGKREGEGENMPELLEEIILFLGRQQLGQYPKGVKTLAFLSSALIFTAVVGQEEYKEMGDELICILGECGGNAQGNEGLFQIEWAGLFELARGNIGWFSEKGWERLGKLILGNVYISGKVAKEFGEKCLEEVGGDLQFEKEVGMARVSLNVLGYIVQELGEKGTKKSQSVLLDHAKQLGTKLVEGLSEGEILAELHGGIKSMKKGKRKSGRSSSVGVKVPESFVSEVMQACHLLLKGKPYILEETRVECEVIVLPYLQFALEWLEVCEGSASSHAFQFLLESLKSFELWRGKLGEDFLRRLWNCSCASGQGETTLKVILETANEEEFTAICESILEGVGEEGSAANLLTSLVQAELTGDGKKQTRRITVERSLYKYLPNLSKWRELEGARVEERVVPYLQFQTGLLRRRKPMGNLHALAVSLASVTAIPLDRIEDGEGFKRVFSQVCELLNALTIHRLDVLSFRTHVFLQCFQFLTDALVKRADQRNRLTDGEIYDLRHCAHCIERICQSAKLGRHEFTRNAPYLVVVLLKQFEKVTVYPIVKNPLLNGCYKLLDMCDENGISHVNSMLSPGSREIFKTVYELYKKFYRYKGKV